MKGLAVLRKPKQQGAHRDRTGRTELHYAAADADGGCAPAIKQMLAQGGDPNDRDHAGLTPLHFAAQYGGIDTVTMLLDAGADPNAQDDKGDTPLFYAFRSPWSTTEVVRLLRDRGADAGIANHRGQSPLWLIGMISNKPEIRSLFVDDDEV
ncbi:ankyrin repeat domain-containing protein [Nocardia coubleae]|uniref:Ankyrin repeat domain-containing protein n=1 Tax=Nocardia coubleae TaxID=356147 RepID=A0A846WAV1_9NOCA|nr:ankyrin repeat domain-containing protein [Nocardia coubleae]NKX90401.1 ankyrin repeat domain-containing protein [Nocardia coubleae]